MGFDPVNDRRNFTAAKDPEYFKQQMEEMHATEHHTFAPGTTGSCPRPQYLISVWFLGRAQFQRAG